MRIRTPAAALCGFALGLAAAASAQSGKDHLWPRFDVAIGSYQISSSDDIRIDGTIERFGQELDLARDFGLPERQSVLGGGFNWAFADKHSIGLSTYSLERSGSRSIRREVEIGDTVFPIGATASLDLDQTLIEAKYDYWFLRRDNFGLGGSLGLVYLSLDARASARVELGSIGFAISEEESASTDLPVPMVGLVTKGSPWPWLVLHAGARYLPTVTLDQYEGEAASYAIGADFYVWGPLAVGVAYSGTYFRADIEDSDWNGSVDISNEGAQVYLRAGF